MSRWLPRIPHLRLAALAAALGLAGGGAAWVLVHLIGLFTNLVLFQQWGWDAADFADLHRGPLVVVVGRRSARRSSRCSREVVAGHPRPRHPGGDGGGAHPPEPDRAAHRRRQAAVGRGRDRHRRPVRRRRTDHRHRRRARLAARPGDPRVGRANARSCSRAVPRPGMAATFGAPLAAVVLAIELLLFEFSTAGFVPLVVATSVAGAMHAAAFGPGPLFHVPAHDFAGLAQLPWFALLGVGCGLLATLIAKGLFAVEGAYRRLPVSESWHPIIGAVAWASLGLLVPARPRRRLRRHRRRPRRPPRARHAGGAGGRQARHLVDGARLGHVGRHAGADPASSAPAPVGSSGELVHEVVPVGVGDVVRARRHGRHVRRRDAGTVRGDRVRVRAHPRLQRDPAADAGDGPRRARHPATLHESLMTEKLARRGVTVPSTTGPT